MRRSSAVVLVGSLMIATACSSSDRVARSSPTAVAGSAAAVARLSFTGTTLDDTEFDGSTLAGKDAVVWFWAPWCTQCRREAPHVAALQAANAGKVTFVGVAGLGEVAAMRDFVTDYGVGAFPHVEDRDGAIWQRFGVTRQPAYAFIDSSGRVEVIRGEMGAEGLAAKVKELAGA